MREKSVLSGYRILCAGLLAMALSLAATTGLSETPLPILQAEPSGDRDQLRGEASASQAPMPRSQLSTLLSSPINAGFAKADQPRTFHFPEDHGPHPQFRNEWWYLTGNLDSDAGDRFGFELTIFRFALTPAMPQSLSAWRSNQLYIAHFAITDAVRQQFYVAERYSRGALGLAGAQSAPFRVWIDDWQIAARQDAARQTDTSSDSRELWQLRARDEHFSLDLSLSAEKAPVLNGVDGLSQKSAAAGNASYYYSITRWQTGGQLRIGARHYNVSGLSWLDREWSSSALGDEQQGWDWFALQLTDGSELMLYNLRRTDGSRDSHSAGTWIGADGRSQHLTAEQFSIDVNRHWTSPAGGTYPAGWHIRVPRQQLSLRIAPVIDGQELFTTVRYWEGAVDVTGSRGGIGVAGRGYVELTGYAE